jgi:hypothetical protein
MVMSVALLSYLFVAVTVPAATAAATKPSTINVDNLVLPEGISAVMIGDYSKAPDLKADGAKPYSCLAIYLVSSLNSATVVHVSGLTLAASDGGTNILHGGSLSGYITVRRKTAGSDFLPSSQALGRLSPSGTFSNPLTLRNPSTPAIPDVLNCQTASIGRMYGLTVSSKVNYLTSKTLYLAGQVDLAKASTYDVSQLTVPEGFKADTTFTKGSGYLSSCIRRDGQSTTIGIALKVSGPFAEYAASGKYIARNVTVDGVSYASPGIPNFRSTCIPVAIVPNDEMGDITGDRKLVITGDIIEWPGEVVSAVRVKGETKMAKVQLGAVDSDKIAVTYDPSTNKSLVWLTAKSRGSLPKCKSTTFDYAGLTSSYVSESASLRGTALVTTTKAKKYAAIKVTSGGADTYAVMSLPGNIFESDGKLTLSGNLVATDVCTS